MNEVGIPQKNNSPPKNSTREYNVDELIADPLGVGKDTVIRHIPELSESQKMALKTRVKERFKKESSLPYNEQNSIFVSDSKEILAALETHTKRSITYNFIELIDLKEKAVTHMLKTIKREGANIRKVMNACLSAYTDNPINIVFISQSSTGKTYLVESVSKYFPAEDLIIRKSISRKAFTRERGRLVIKTFTDDGAEYNEFVENAFTGESMTVSQYINYLSSEIESKENKENPGRLERIREERERITVNLMTLIDFTDKILVLLERPPLDFWADMLSVAAHDSRYLESEFVEGDGKKYTKHIVYKNWPAIIFCTSKDSDFSWKDLETRFEIAEPFESSEKFTEAIDLSLERMFGEPISEDPEAKEIRNHIRQLVAYMKEHRPKPYLPLQDEIRKAFLGDKVSRPDLMRKFPRLVYHIALNALFSAPDRVIFKNDGELVLVSREDFMELLKEFSNNELNAALHGFTESAFLFLTEVLIPACRDGDATDGPYRNPTQAEVCRALSESDLNLGKTKQRCGQYLKALEERNVIKRVQDEEDKRGLRIIPLVDEIQKLSNKIENSVEELVNTYKKALPEHIDKMLKQNYKPFHRGKEIGKMPMSNTRQEIVKSIPDHDIWEKNNELQKLNNSSFLITSILEISGYFTNGFTNFSDESVSYSGNRFTNFNDSQVADQGSRNLDPFDTERSRFVLYRIKKDFKGENGLTYWAGLTLSLHPTDNDVSRWLEEGKIEIVENPKG